MAQPAPPHPAPAPYRPGVHRFAVALVLATFFLLVLGGTVTSQGVGLSVPDWPTTYGYNMFGTPMSVWIGRGGVFWEHAHRLAGSFVGVMTIILTELIWLPFLRAKMPYRLCLRPPFFYRTTDGCNADTQAHDRRWLRWVAVAALGLVIVQGVMGGLRVTEVSITLAIAHGVTAQLFLCVTVFIAAATSRVWAQAAQATNGAPPARYGSGLRLASVVVLGVMAVQLVLGATMRHTGARLAIPDFPSAYGGAIPPLTQTGITESINRIPYDQAPSYYSPVQVGVHFAHRVWAVVVLAAAVWLIAQVSTRASSDPRLLRPTTAMAGLLIAQVALGALIVWTGLSAANNSVATAHQATGAALLATATLVAIRAQVLSPPPSSPHPQDSYQNHDQAGLPAELMRGTA